MIVEFQHGIRQLRRGVPEEMFCPDLFATIEEAQAAAASYWPPGSEIIVRSQDYVATRGRQTADPIDLWHCDTCDTTVVASAKHDPNSANCLMFQERNREHELIGSRDNPKGEAHGWIQWKGTNVCVDLHCKCGTHGHFDGDFMYAVQCKDCGRKYRVGQNIALIELTTPEMIEIEERYGARYKEFSEDD